MMLRLGSERSFGVFGVNELQIETEKFLLFLQAGSWGFCRGVFLCLVLRWLNLVIIELG